MNRRKITIVAALAAASACAAPPAGRPAAGKEQMAELHVDDVQVIRTRDK